MEEPKRFLTLAEIFGVHLEEGPRGEVCRHWLALDFELGQATDEEFAKLAPRDQVFVLVHEFDGVVQNGGIHEFFCRRVGDFARETLDALAAIGAEDAHRCLRQICDLFPDRMPHRNEDVRKRQIYEIVARLPDNVRPFLDSFLTPGPDNEPDIDKLLMNYWKRQGEDGAKTPPHDRSSPLRIRAHDAS